MQPDQVIETTPENDIAPEPVQNIVEESIPQEEVYLNLEPMLEPEVIPFQADYLEQLAQNTKLQTDIEVLQNQISNFENELVAAKTELKVERRNEYLYKQLAKLPLLCEFSKVLPLVISLLNQEKDWWVENTPNLTEQKAYRLNPISGEKEDFDLELQLFEWIDAFGGMRKSWAGLSASNKNPKYNHSNSTGLIGLKNARENLAVLGDRLI